MRRYFEKLQRLLGPLLVGRKRRRAQAEHDLYEWGRILASEERDRLISRWPHVLDSHREQHYMKIKDTYNDEFVKMLLKKAGADVGKEGTDG